MLFTHCLRGSLIFIIWLPHHVLFFQIPQLDAHRLWCQVSGDPRKVVSFFQLYLSRRMSNKKHWRQTASCREVQRPHGWECISSTIQCLQRKLCHNGNHYIMDHKRSAKYKAQRLGVQYCVWSTKADFFVGSFGLQRTAGAQSGPMGISTFLQNKEQGFHVRTWATAMDQLTSVNPHTVFLLPAWETLPLIYQSTLRSNRFSFEHNALFI